MTMESPRLLWSLNELGARTDLSGHRQQIRRPRFFARHRVLVAIGKSTAHVRFFHRA